MKLKIHIDQTVKGKFNFRVYDMDVPASQKVVKLHEEMGLLSIDEAIDALRNWYHERWQEIEDKLLEQAISRKEGPCK